MRLQPTRRRSPRGINLYYLRGKITYGSVVKGPIGVIAVGAVGGSWGGAEHGGRWGPDGGKPSDGQHDSTEPRRRKS